LSSTGQTGDAAAFLDGSDRKQALQRLDSRHAVADTRVRRGVRWFDRALTSGPKAPPPHTQRANIQINSLRDAFHWLEYDLVEQVGVTVSFGTVDGP